ncbi:MAG: YfhO family protein, partial [Candidatus Binatia bacterium]
ISFLFLDKEIDLSSLYGLRLFFIRDIPWIVSLYIGVIAFPAILLWLFNSSLRERVVLLGLIMTTLILAMGHYTFVFGFLYQYLPLFKLFRFPEKFLFVTSALALYVVLSGLFYLFQSKDSFPRGLLLALLAPGLLWLTLYLLLRVERESLVQFINQVGITTSRVSYILESSAAILIHLERQIALTVGTILILFLWKKGRLKTVLSQSLLVGLVFFDLSTAHQPYQFQLDPAFVYEKDKMIPAPDPKPSRLFYLSRLTYLHPDFYTLSKRSFADKVPTVHENLIPNTGVLYGFDYLQELDALARRPYSLLFTVGGKLPPEKLYRLLGVMNVKYLISAEALPSGEITLLNHFAEYPAWLYRIDRVTPRAYIVRDISVEEDPLKVLDRLSSSEFDPNNEVILERPLSMPSNENLKAQAEITRYANHSVTIRTAMDHSGVLVLADSFYPGWKVFVDGEEREVLRANYFFRGVFLSPGDHRVVFRYEPASLYYGAVISLLTLVVFSLILIRMRKT